MKTKIITFDLNNDWQFHQVGNDEWLPAEVPGTVHTDLFKNNRIGDPFYRTNERDQQWIDKVDWEYKTIFQLDENLLSKENLRLVFKGLDTYADVYLNDEKLLSANNMFREWAADCKRLLKPGVNELKIYFHSPIKIDLPKLENLGYQLPAVNDQSENGGLGDKKISVFARKAGYHYGWDWGPRFVTSGIWRPIYLHAWDNVRIENIQIIQNSVSKEKAEISAIFEIESSSDLSAMLSVHLDNEKQIKVEKPAKLTKGMNSVSVDFEIESPKLWWSNGLGEPHLYSLVSQLKIANSLCDEQKTQFGIRTLKVVQKKDEVGTSFYFELNGVPVFAKGANYIPNDSFLPRVTKERYEHAVKFAADANMNMLRVWGGGIYEDDIFYDLCDKYGIMIWQDFMFACSMYPGDEAFLENVKAEAIQNAKRLRNHPCLVLWCGNNEIDVAWSQDTPGGWGWKERFSEDIRKKIWNDYENIFHRLLPQVVAEYDPKTFYWPSSPLADWNKRASYESTSGDIHYWGVWHGKEPFENFKIKIGRFMSEYGFQSFPELSTIKTYTLPEDWDINSEVMAAHQRSGIGNRRIKEYMDMYYRNPKDFESLLYVGQVLQAEGIKSAIEAHRRKMPYCMGSLYWQLNDCWPVASWSSTDYYGRWKALHYFARKAYEDVLLSPIVENDMVQVFIVSDKLKPFHALLKLEVMDFAGHKPWHKELPVDISANSSKLYYQESLSELLKGIPV
ncbi:glycoside hydrolase family 2 protein, partial [candidate division KSB1 bacterium]|nr:glycoside hydrolase family 2 protein [candidate division KSB1 bacterium]